MEFQNILRLDFSPTEILRLWSGAGDLRYDNADWKSGASILRIGDSEVGLGVPNKSTPVSLSGIPLEYRRHFIDDFGEVPVSLQAIWRNIPGVFQAVGRGMRGVLTHPRLTGDIFSFEISPKISDVDRGRIENWSQEDQQRRYPNDDGFKDLRIIIDGFKHTWPP